MNYSGERFMPGLRGTIEAEHRHRYRLAREVAYGCDVLDVACGEGYGSHLLSGVAKSVVGVDIAEEAVTHARAKYQGVNLRFVQGDCAELPLENASVDLVVSFETIEHHTRHQEMMSEIRRVLRPGGLLLISSPNRLEYGKTLSQPNAFHVKELDFVEFADLLKANFRNTKFYAQRVLSASVLAPYLHEEVGFKSFMEKNEVVGTLERPVFFLALAGDVDLPILGATIVESRADNLRSPETSLLEMRLYLSELVDESAQPYQQERGAAQVFSLDSARKSIRLVLPPDTQSLYRLRLDIANAPAAIQLHTLVLQDASGSELWRWEGDCESFLNPRGVVCCRVGSGVTLLCLNDDPQFDLAIPGENLARAGGGSNLTIELTPKHLLDELPSVLGEIRNAQKASPLATADAHVPVGVSAHLTEIAEMLKTQITRRNEIISTQRVEIESMRNREQMLYEQIIRAEAQLELLKEFALSEASYRLERL